MAVSTISSGNSHGFFLAPRTGQGALRPLSKPEHALNGATTSVLDSSAAVVNSQSDKDVIKAFKVITRRDYSTLAALKLAGRPDEKIAEIMGTRTESVRPHVAKAVAEYRRGEIAVNHDQVREQAVAEAAEDGAEVSSKLLGSTAYAEAAGAALAAAAGATPTKSVDITV